MPPPKKTGVSIWRMLGEDQERRFLKLVFAEREDRPGLGAVAKFKFSCDNHVIRRDLGRNFIQQVTNKLHPRLSNCED